MRIYRAKDYEEMSRKAANLIAAQVIMKPDCVLGLATGTTPIGTYRQLVEGYEKGDLDFSAVKTVNLDEYKGLSPENNQSYRYFMNENLFRHVNICLENTNVPNGLAEDAEAECARYNQVIRDLGGIDLQLLGLGVNGHIGFNEPDDAFAKETHLVTLTQSTIDANARFFEKKEDVPTMAITMGMGDIMAAKQVVLVATGLAKVPAIKGLVMNDEITTKNPSTMLKMHENAVVVIDKELADAVGYKA